jgi:hypothetical protein
LQAVIQHCRSLVGALMVIADILGISSAAIMGWIISAVILARYGELPVRHFAGRKKLGRPFAD